jgi:hypothetical protein
VNDSTAGIFTRNVHYTRMQYRRWCGHQEILRSADAQLRLLECVAGLKRVSSASVSVPDTASLQDLFNFSTRNGFLMKQERVHVKTATLNRVAEVTLSMPLVDCHYEIRREGQPHDCTYCVGTKYTENCGPTYNALLPLAEASRPVSQVHQALPRASDASRMRGGWTSAQGDVLGQGLRRHRVDLLLNGSTYDLLDRLCVCAGVAGANLDGRWRELWVLRNRQPHCCNRAQQQNQKGQYIGQDRAVNEEFCDHGLPAPSRW